MPAVDIFSNGDILKKANEADHIEEGAIDSDEEEVDNQSSGAGSSSNGAPGGSILTHGDSGNLNTNPRLAQPQENKPLSTFSLGTSQQSNNV